MSALTPDAVILGLLAYSPKHGYDLLACFEDTAQLGRVWKLSTSQIYNVLKRLETQGHIIGNQIITENAPPRTQYTLTAAGATILETWLNDPAPSASVRKVRVEFMSRLHIARLLNLPTKAIIQHQRHACEAEYHRLLRERKNSVIGTESFVLDFVIAQLSAILQWLALCEDEEK